MKHIVHVNRHRIRDNAKKGVCEPVLTHKTYKGNAYGHEAVLRDKSGCEVGRFVYRPGRPLACGAVLWFETSALSVETLVTP